MEFDYTKASFVLSLFNGCRTIVNTYILFRNRFSDFSSRASFFCEILMRMHIAWCFDSYFIKKPIFDAVRFVSRIIKNALDQNFKAYNLHFDDFISVYNDSFLEYATAMANYPRVSLKIAIYGLPSWMCSIKGSILDFFNVYL